MRLLNISLFLIVIYLSIGIFDQTLDANFQGYGNGNMGWFLFATIFQPWNWTGSVGLYTILLGAITVAVGMAAFASVLGRSDLIALYAAFGVFMSAGALPCIVLYSFVARNVGQFAGCAIDVPCAAANLIGGLTAGVVALIWIFTCLEWWAWRSTTQ